MNVLIPMAGEGNRFKICGYETPKPLILVDNIPMIQGAVETLNIPGNYIFVIREYQNKNITYKLESLLKKIAPECKIIKVDKVTDGAVETCLFAKEYIDNDEELIITNCDQLLTWDSSSFLKFTKLGYDGVVVTYNSSDPKNSFISLDESGYGKELREKTPISELALIGLHYWKRGSDFVESANKMISDHNKDKNEYYIAPTYNYLIDAGKKIKNFHLEKNQYTSIGTPEDLKIYIGKLNEYRSDKPKTIICDLDGTILKHIHKYSNLDSNSAELIDGIVDKFDEWDSLGLKIILMTGRKESARVETEKTLERLRIPYDCLIMNAGNGTRILINDKLTSHSEDRAISVNVTTDVGFNSINWTEIGL